MTRKNPAASPRCLKDRAALRDKLAELMALKENEWPGHPFADEDGSFGVNCGKVKGGLYAAYFLADHLRDQKFFAGRQKARTDLDCAVYELGPEDPKQLFPEVKLWVDSDGEIQLRITTDKPLDKIILALDSAIAAEQAEIRLKQQQEREYQEGRERDRQREIRGPVVSKHADLAILQEYVEQKMRTHVPHTAFVKFGSGPMDPELARMLEDSRSCNTFHYLRDGEQGCGKENEFFNRTLRDVFKGFCAVHLHHPFGQGKWTQMEFDIRGNPARLVQDILEHDFKSVPAVARALKAQGKLEPADEGKFIQAIAEYGQKDKDAAVITKGSAEEFKVGRPLKIRVKGPQ